jgi:hypothetical protein
MLSKIEASNSAWKAPPHHPDYGSKVKLKRAKSGNIGEVIHVVFS